MEIKRAVLAVFAAGALIVAGGCRSSYRTTTSSSDVNTTPAMATSSTSTTETSSYTPSSSSTTTSTTLAPTTVSQTTTTDQNGTTTTLPNGSTVTRSETTTVLYPDGSTKTLTPDEVASLGTHTASDGTKLVNMPPGAAVVTKTVTTITTPPPQNTIVTTTVPAPAPMTSSTSVAYPVPVPYSVSGRRIPGLDFLAFANRASFNSSNAFPGTLNTGDIRTDIRNQTGYGLGVNAWFNRHLSAELTASRIHPQTSFIPANAGVNPITGLRLRMTPITGTLQIHFNPYSVVDAYFGGGAAYVLFKADQTFNPGTSGLTAINFRDEWGPLVNGGLGFNISRHFGINLDGKYMWVRARATPTFNTAVVGNVGNTERIGVNPLLISAGIRFGF